MLALLFCAGIAFAADTTNATETTSTTVVATTVSQKCSFDQTQAITATTVLFSLRHSFRLTHICFSLPHR